MATKPTKPRKPKLTKKALACIDIAEQRFLAARLDLANAMEIFQAKPDHWAGVIWKEPDARQRFLDYDLDNKEIVAQIHDLDPPAMRPECHEYLKRLQAVLKAEEGTLPLWADVLAEFAAKDANEGNKPGSPTEGAEEDEEDMATRSTSRRRSGGLRRDRKEEAVAAEETTEEVVEPEEGAPEEEAPAKPERSSRRRSGGRSRSKPKVEEPEPEDDPKPDCDAVDEGGSDGSSEVVGLLERLLEGQARNEAVITELRDQVAVQSEEIATLRSDAPKWVPTEDFAAAMSLMIYELNGVGDQYPEEGLPTWDLVDAIEWPEWSISR